MNAALPHHWITWPSTLSLSCIKYIYNKNLIFTSPEGQRQEESAWVSDWTVNGKMHQWCSTKCLQFICEVMWSSSCDAHQDTLALSNLSWIGFNFKSSLDLQSNTFFWILRYNHVENRYIISHPSLVIVIILAWSKPIKPAVEYRWSNI